MFIFIFTFFFIFEKNVHKILINFWIKFIQSSVDWAEVSVHENHSEAFIFKGIYKIGRL